MPESEKCPVPSLVINILTTRITLSGQSIGCERGGRKEKEYLFFPYFQEARNVRFKIWKKY